MGQTSAERQRTWRERRMAEGFVKMTVLVRATQAADVRHVCARLSSDPDLEIGTLRNTRTGKLVKKDWK